ncbi:MAG: hypothetical protein ACO3I4_02270 [Candidatus Kapaibacteriota bacterium]|jgi:hypothetical protein
MTRRSVLLVLTLIALLGSASTDMMAQLMKRMPEGSEFVLTVNKDQDMRHLTVRWFKDGVLLRGEHGQELRYPIARPDMAGVYTVELAGPCATVTSKPMQVIIEPRGYIVQSDVESGTDGSVIAGKTHETDVSGFTLFECQPNPVTDQATIRFSTAATSDVVVKVVDLHGAVVATLVNDVLPAGEHTVTIDTREHNMQSSLYYYVLSAPGYTATKPMMLVK